MFFKPFIIVLRVGINEGCGRIHLASSIVLFF